MSMNLDQSGLKLSQVLDSSYIIDYCRSLWIHKRKYTHKHTHTHHFTDPKKKPNEDISAMQLEALYISRSTITDLVSICQGE